MSNEIDRLFGSSGSVIYPGLGGPVAGDPAVDHSGAQPRPSMADPAQPPDAPAESDVDPLREGEPGGATDPQSRRYQRWRNVSAGTALGAVALVVVLVLVLSVLPHRAQPAAASGHKQVPSSARATGQLRGEPEPSAASASATASVNTSGDPVTGEPSPVRAGAGGPAPFQPVTYEAEAPENVRSGPALIQAYLGASGGAVVTDLSSDLSGAAPGTLTFTAVQAPATGRYTLVVSYLYVIPPSVTTSSLVVTVAGSAPVTVPVSSGQGATCCATSPIPVVLRAGVNSITFGNPSDGVLGIDRIVLTQ